MQIELGAMTGDEPAERVDAERDRRPTGRQELRAQRGSVLAAFAVATGAFAQHPTYDVYLLGDIEGQPAIPAALNESGIVVGTAGIAVGRERAFRWEQGQLRPLRGRDGNVRTMAYDINEIGLIVGQADGRASVWRGPGQRVEFGEGEFVAINDTGTIVGYPSVARFRSEAYVIGGGPSRIIAPPFAIACLVTGINNEREVVGVHLCDIQFGTGSFVWSGSGFNFVSDCREPFSRRINDINDLGQYVVWDGRAEIGLLFERNGDWQVVGQGVEPLGLNNQGEVVGYRVDDGIPGHRGVIWSEAGLIDLNTRVLPGRWVIEQAIDVNDRGMVIASGRRIDDRTRELGFLLVPNPIEYRLGLGDLPPVAGRPVEFFLVGATPRRDQYLFAGVDGLGSAAIPFLNVTLDVRRPFLLGAVEAGDDGRTIIVTTLPRSMRDKAGLFQVAEFDATTNPLALDVQ